jgi:hypothetical protein
VAIVRSARAVAAVVVILLAAADRSSASTTIGQAFEFGCGTGPATWIQTESPNGSHAAPVEGVITSWSIYAPSGNSSARFKVVRRVGVGIYSLVGESPLTPMTPSALNRNLTRVPVEAGDVLGVYGVLCLGMAPSTYVGGRIDGDAPTGASVYSTEDGISVGIEAELEPDADGDGFGDETQDACPTDATTQAACPVPPAGAVPDGEAPAVEITKGPQNEVERSSVRFAFASDDPSATFECKLKGPDLPRGTKRFSECASPRRYRQLDPGRFKFQVRATDAAGNVGDPARDRFRVVGPD